MLNAMQKGSGDEIECWRGWKMCVCLGGGNIYRPELLRIALSFTYLGEFHVMKDIWFAVSHSNITIRRRFIFKP